MTNTTTTSKLELPTGTWSLDEAQTTTTIAVKKLGLLNISADLAVGSSSIEIDDKNQITGIEIEVDAASYTSGNDKRDEHVRGADFLDADAFPTLTFKAATVAQTAAGHEAKGTLTIKGQTHPLTVKITDVVVDASAGTASFAASGTADRKSLGIDKMPAFIIGSKLVLAVSANAARN